MREREIMVGVNERHVTLDQSCKLKCMHETSLQLVDKAYCLLLGVVPFWKKVSAKCPPVSCRHIWGVGLVGMDLWWGIVTSRLRRIVGGCLSLQAVKV